MFGLVRLAGKKAPLRRLTPGDGLIYYAPREKIRERARLQCFCALGVVRPGQIYQVQQRPGFWPFRRDVAYLPPHDAPITPLLPQLEFAAGAVHWGLLMRRGLFEITEADFRRVAYAMGLSQAGLTAHFE